VTRQRWKVLVLGSSIPDIVAPGRRSRDEGTYAEVLEWTLRESGYDLSVQNSSHPFDLIHQGARRFIEHDQWDHFPDILVINFGFNECRPPVVPWSLLRHLHRHYWSLSRTSDAYRRLVVPRLWKIVRAFHRMTSGWVGLRTWRMSPKRFERELKRLITTARLEKMLVLVVDVHPPGQRMLNISPGLTERCALYRRLEAEIVAGFDEDEVRLIPVSDLVTELGIENAVPDAVHFSAECHRRVAAMLAAEIAPWLELQCAGAMGLATVTRSLI